MENILKNYKDLLNESNGRIIHAEDLRNEAEKHLKSLEDRKNWLLQSPPTTDLEQLSHEINQIISVQNWIRNFFYLNEEIDKKEILKKHGIDIKGDFVNTGTFKINGVDLEDLE